MSLFKYDVCEMCGKPPNGSRKSTQVLHLDHCHKTERYRGYLCHKCNTGLGLLGDREGVLNALSYLNMVRDLRHVEDNEEDYKRYIARALIARARALSSPKKCKCKGICQHQLQHFRNTEEVNSRILKDRKNYDKY